MRKKYIIIAGIVVVAGLLFVVFFSPGPDLSTYEFLKQPRITRMADQKMVVVTAQGDPNAVGSKAFGLLFKTYFKIPGVPKRMSQAPRARWSGDVNVKSSWTGYYAMPVPDQIGSLPAVEAEPGLKVELTTWEYGEVAEILYIGPYAEETPTIKKLHAYISQQGYKIIGLHEEEYLKGPGMFFKGDPTKYYTIIRYRVKKTA